MRTVEGIVEAHQIATERRRQGKPIWAEKVRLGDVFHNEDMSFTEKRDAIVARIKATRWYKNADPRSFDGLFDIVDHIEHAEDVDEFDGWWDELYDHADRDRVWIETR